jgi:hypothetical protein
MKTINRTVITILPKKPYIDWANSFDDSGPTMTPDSIHATSILIPEEYDEYSYEQFLKKNYKIIFEVELAAWMDDLDSWPSKLEEIGLQYFEGEDTEKIEEDSAVPENDRQKNLVSYFDGKSVLSETTLKLYLKERESDNPNFPLIRKYFKKVNPHLKNLLLFGLKQKPTDMYLLNDLAYFHEFENILEILIDHFISACVQENNMGNFSEMIEEFYDSTFFDGYDAIAQLQQIFPVGTEKRELIDLFASELMKQNKDPDDMEF